MGKCETCAHKEVCGYAGDDDDRRATTFCADFSPEVDRDALLDVADRLEAIKFVDSDGSMGALEFILWSMLRIEAKRIREACGVEVGQDGME